MITHKLNKLPKNTYQITATIPWKEIEKEYEKSFEKLSEDLTVEGFRKGKAPKKIAEEHLSKDKVFNHMIRSLLPVIYSDIVKKEEIKPIISPKIDLQQAKEGEDWVILFTVVERPDVDLKNYQETVKKAKAEAKKADIWVPGTEEKKPNPEQSSQEQMNVVLNSLLKNVPCEIPDLIIEEELQQRLTRLVDDVQKLGLTMENYVQSKGTTIEDLKKQYTKEIEEMYKIEFILGAIGDEQKIEVNDSDIEELVNHAKDEKEREFAKQNAYYYASFMRKQKTLAYLLDL
ncbi:hypothetical protein HGA88_04275 [Candidatus Roizmanbacteria bacterium]|nr:hypothetical protein [Candidatus Roizmanbacteria bacterium]